MPEILKSRIQTGTPTAPTSKETQSLATKLKSSREYLDELKQLSESPEYTRTAPEDTRQSLKAAISRAEQLYQERATRNDWLEVAQTLGRAMAQFGAAQSGMQTGRDLSGLQFGPGIDYGARTERAFREYQQGLRTAQEEADLTRQRALDIAAGKGEEFGRREKYLQEALRASREEGAERRQAGREDIRESAFQTRAELQDLAQQEKTLRNQLRARQTLVNQLQQEGDLSGKAVSKLQERYGAVAAQGDVDLAALRGEIEEAQIEKSLLGFKYKTADVDKQKEILNEKVTEVRNMLEAIRARRAELLSGQGGKTTMSNQQGGAAETEEREEGTRKVPPSPSVDPEIQKYADQYLAGDYEKAKGVLVKRGYSPRE